MSITRVGAGEASERPARGGSRRRIEVAREYPAFAAGERLELHRRVISIADAEELESEAESRDQDVDDDDD